MVLWAMLLAGCESDYEREERVWNETYAEIVSTYRDREPGTGTTSPSVQGRKAFVDEFHASFVTRKPFEATSPEEIGLVVFGSTKSDATGSATYDNGAKGYGGNVTERAWAHPEGVLVAERNYRCEAPSIAYSVGDFDLGTTCGSDRDSRLQWAAQLIGEEPVSGSNTDWQGTQAYEALAKPYRDRLGEATVATPPSLKQRKALVMVEKHGKWRVAQSKWGAPATFLARGADEVGLVLLQTLAFENKPSHTYPSGLQSFGGTGTLYAFAHPEGTLVAKREAPCEHDDASLVRALRATQTRFCGVPTEARAAFLSELTGE